MSDRHILLIVGAGRSGTSLTAGVIAALGWRVPQPEMSPNKANLRGFGEPRWVVEFHSELLRESQVATMDSRPVAFEIASRAACDPAVGRRLESWLGHQLADAGQLVIKDPRTAWFLQLWQDSARSIGVGISYLTVLRHPAEVVASARRFYDARRSDAGLTASWVNIMVNTERSTRGFARSFVQYDRLLADWSAETGRVAAELDLRSLAHPTPEQRAAVDGLITPELRRAPPGWDQLTVPTDLRDVADRTWDRLNALVGAPPRSQPADNLDVQAAYERLYADAESVAESSIVAVQAAAEARRLRHRASSVVRACRRVVG